ncbi:MAG TPA: hypothetical protein PKD86_17155 [Gemmatales bacterium]|nr:hypothetical protein [Gemmatales bacterium]HMP61074.1 hypothetical protein [Gemmatales bacterium]
MTDAVAHYHDLLDAGWAADAQAHLERYQQQHGLYFGERPLCSVLRPRLMSVPQYDFLRARVKLLAQAFAKMQAAALADPAVRRQFGLTPEEEELVQDDPGFACAYPTSRLDAFYVSEDELKFTEFNSETPAGAMYNHALIRLFHGMPVMREFAKRWQTFSLPTHIGVVRALLESYAEWAGRRDLPRIAILDWKEVPTYSEFRLFDECFKHYGIDSVIADPREVELKDGKLWAEGKPIDLIYKRVLISELIERGGLNHPVVRAVRARQVCMINPFRCKVLFKKASFAVLSDERNRHLLAAEEWEAVAAHIPWTRTVEARRTEDPSGQSVDLVEYIGRQRERLVLKPNDDYGGKGIVLGWTVDAATWEQAIRTALATPYIVQDRVRLPKEPYPDANDGALRIVDRMVDTDPYIIHGTYMEGSLCRISTEDLLNVTAGGGSTVPTFLVAPR